MMFSSKMLPILPFYWNKKNPNNFFPFSFWTTLGYVEIDRSLEKNWASTVKDSKLLQVKKEEIYLEFNTPKICQIMKLFTGQIHQA